MNMRMTRRGAGILIALMLIAVPAAAAVMTQNFVSASVELNGKCFTMTAGADDSSPWVDFSPGVVTAGSVDLAQETVRVRGFGGNRMIFSDVASLNNDCGDIVTVEYTPAADPNGQPAFQPALSDPVWNDFVLTFYIANTDAPGDVLTSGDWEVVLVVDAGSASAPNTVTVPNGGSRTMAVVIDTDNSVTSLIPTEVATLRWTAQIIHP